MGVAGAKIPVIEQLNAQFSIHLWFNGLAGRATSLALPVRIEAEGQSDV